MRPIQERYSLYEPMRDSLVRAECQDSVQILYRLQNLTQNRSTNEETVMNMPFANASSKTAANADASSMNTDTESFVHVMDDTAMDVPSSLSLAVTPRHAVVGADASMDTIQVCVTVKAGELPNDGKRSPVDLIVALDCSGSMSGPKLDLCKTTLERIVRFLLPTDRFGLVSFADEAVIEIPAQKMNTENKKAAIDTIKSIRTRASTNISAAIGLAANEIKRIGEPNEVRTIFLLTDGLANQGITDAAGMVELTKNCLVDFPFHQQLDAVRPSTRGICSDGDVFKQQSRGSTAGKEPPSASSKTIESSNVPFSATTRTPITLHCFGYGMHHDSQLLSTLASSATPGGTYYFVENDKNVGEAFGDALGGVLSIVAQSTVVTISVPPEAAVRGVTIVDVFHEQKIKRDDGSYSVTIGDFYAEESRDVIFEIKLASGVKNESAPTPHASVSISYTDTLQKQPVFLGPSNCFISRPEGKEVSEENKHVVVQWLRVATTNRIAVARRLGVKNLEAARSVILSARQVVVSAPDVQDDPVVIQLAKDLREVQAGLVSKEAFRSGAHVMTSTLQQHSTQRFSSVSIAPSGPPSVYRSKAKDTMSASFKLN